MWTRVPIPMPMISPASSPTSTRARSSAARTNGLSWESPATSGCRATIDRELGRGASALPGERDLVEHAVAEPLGRPGDRLATQGTVEFHRRLVVRQGPDHQAFHAALGEVAPRRGEQPAAEAEALEFRTQVKLVDLAVIEQAAGAV